MGFKEKSAWVMFTSLSAGAYVYGYAIVKNIDNLYGVPLTAFVIPYILIIVVASIVGNIVAAVTAAAEADEPSDERDEMIAVQSNSASCYVLGFGVVAGLFHYLYSANGDLLFHIVLGSLTLSAIAEYALQIYFYRWGS